MRDHKYFDYKRYAKYYSRYVNRAKRVYPKWGFKHDPKDCSYPAAQFPSSISPFKKKGKD